VGCTQFRRDALRGLTDDGEAPHDRALLGRIGVQEFRRDPGADRQKVVTLGENVPEKLTRLE
jgi:hypothetical protein